MFAFTGDDRAIRMTVSAEGSIAREEDILDALQ